MTVNIDKKNSDRVFMNHNIRAPRVLCINQDNTNLGEISTSQALALAQAAGLDLVQVSPPSRDRPPTCKIIDYGKYKYDLSKKKKEGDKKQREQKNLSEAKEIKFRPSTDENDLQIKARKAEELINDGFKVKICIVFKGRELAHKNIAFDTLQQFMNFIPGYQLSQKPTMSDNNKNLIAFVVKKSESESKSSS